MNEKELRDLVKKVRITVFSGLLLMLVSGVAGNIYSVLRTQERSLNNEKRITDLEGVAVRKGDETGLHQTLINEIKQNEKNILEIQEEQKVLDDKQNQSILELKKENNDNLKYLMDKLDKINQNILDIHKLTINGGLSK